MANDLRADLHRLSHSVVMDHCSTSTGNARVRRKLAQLVVPALVGYVIVANWPDALIRPGAPI